MTPCHTCCVLWLIGSSLGESGPSPSVTCVCVCVWLLIMSTMLGPSLISVFVCLCLVYPTFDIRAIESVDFVGENLCKVWTYIEQCWDRGGRQVLGGRASWRRETWWGRVWEEGGGGVSRDRWDDDNSGHWWRCSTPRLLLYVLILCVSHLCHVFERCGHVDSRSDCAQMQCDAHTVSSFVFVFVFAAEDLLRMSMPQSWRRQSCRWGVQMCMWQVDEGEIILIQRIIRMCEECAIR